MSERLDGLPDNRNLVAHSPHAFVLLCVSLEVVVGLLLLATALSSPCRTLARRRR